MSKHSSKHSRITVTGDEGFITFNRITGVVVDRKGYDYVVQIDVRGLSRHAMYTSGEGDIIDVGYWWQDNGGIKYEPPAEIKLLIQSATR